MATLVGTHAEDFDIEGHRKIYSDLSSSGEISLTKRNNNLPLTGSYRPRADSSHPFYPLFAFCQPHITRRTSRTSTMAQISTTEKPQMQQIDLNTLNLQQLTQLKNQLDQELSIFQESLNTIKMARSKYSASKEALEQFKGDWNEKQILVPLTGSMYVPGTIKDANNVIIEIGTGYYVENDLDSAKEFFKRRIEYVQEQLEKIEMMGIEKSKIRDTIREVMEKKLTQFSKELQAKKREAE
uniref:Prefoldin, alpha subunit n=2 Tax=Anopheles merus TaxID=30066 RepID=A0A182V9P7_ANOME